MNAILVSEFLYALSTKYASEYLGKLISFNIFLTIPLYF